jgi:hypothetical protein
VAASPPFDALGFRFDVTIDDPRLRTYVEALLAALRSTDDAEHHYVLSRSHDGNDQPFELSLDGTRVTATPEAERLVGTLVHDLNRRALEGCAHLALHAGGVEHGGTGVVLPAVSEAGKTTLVAGLVRAGFGYLSDEAVAIDRDTLEIHPYRKPLSIDTGAWPLFPELEPHADLPTDAYKTDQWQVPPAAIRPGALGGPCRVDLVVFPRYDRDAPTTLEPMRRAEALVELAKNTFGFDVQGRAALDLLAEVVRGAECFELVMGDLDGAVELVSALVGVGASPARVS